MARGLRLAYILSPATRVRKLKAFESLALLANTQGSRTRPGLHAFARYAGSQLKAFESLALLANTQGSRTRPGLHAFARLASSTCCHPTTDPHN
jgi:hypothetical protein